jgi:hemerythrin superfamily protein
MDVFELLAKDHRKVEDLLERLSGVAPDRADEREQLFAQLKTELEIHSTVEEEVFYPALEAREATRDEAEEAEEAHAEVRELLAELDAMPKDDPEWAERLGELKLEVLQHVRDEENEIFADARAALTNEQIEDLGRRVTARKQQLEAADGS